MGIIATDGEGRGPQGNGQEKEPDFALFCACGCDEGFHLTTLGGQGYISFVSGNFSLKQRAPLGAARSWLEGLFGKPGKSPRLLTEINATEEDLARFKDFLLEHVTSTGPVENSSHIAIHYDAECDMYWLYLVADMPFLERVRHKYRMYEIAVNRSLAWEIAWRVDASLRRRGKENAKKQKQQGK